METKGDNDCYGTIFPQTMCLGSSSGSGKVFSFSILPAAGTGPVKRDIRVNTEQWDECRRCEEFEECYRFSMTKLAFEIALSQR